MMILPTTLTDSNDGRLLALAAALNDDSLIAAQYGLPGTPEWVDESSLSAVHEIDMNVRLVTAAGRVLELSWAPPGTDEGLVITFRPHEISSDPRINYTDVSGLPQWKAALGRPIEKLGLAFMSHFDPWGERSIRPWALRITTHEAAPVIVALGETDGPVLRFMPDNLVVIFDSLVAQHYEVADGIDSSWGVDI